MSLDQKLNNIVEHYHHLQALLEQPIDDPQKYGQFSKELSSLEELYETVIHYQNLQKQKAEAEAMLQDPDLKQLAMDELPKLEQQIEEYFQKIRILLLPKDVDDDRNVILEVRAGTGGEEAALFAADLLRMYHRYADLHGWQFETLSINDTGLDGIKEAQINIKGKGAFSRLKYESGGHRVQRVPETEAGGRIHTSAATVAVLPEVEEVDVEINEQDLRIDVFRASGAGGQHVNTTDSAVRITHIPTGLVVSQQDERSQHKNKAKALKILRAHLYEIQKRKQEEERSAARKEQVGSGDRSERIRTYNFPQGRVTDHRINLTLYKLQAVLDGAALDEIIDALISDDQAQKLSEFSL